MKNALVILAGGKGSRFGGKLPKQFQRYGNLNFIEYFLENLEVNFNFIVISCNKNYFKKCIKNTKKNFIKSKIIFTKSGNSRQISTFNALKKLKKYNPKNVLIHDSARPLCSNLLINKILKNLKNYEAVIPYITFNDRKIINNKEINENIKFVQTPQGFKFNKIYKFHIKKNKLDFKDDASLCINENIKLRLIKGEKSNLKITQPEDIAFYQSFKKTIYRSGIGYDIHRFDLNTKKGLKLCGIKIPYSKLVGHSDADVGIHAICDSIYGALSMKDIGHYFSNKNTKWKNVNSIFFLNHSQNELKKKGFFITNLDINFICEKPNISKYKNKMIIKLIKILKIPRNIISIKATTNEKLGFIGNGQGIAAEAIVQISNEKFY